MPKNGELNEKQKLFCKYYVASNNGTASYREAYGCSYDSARSSASDLLATPNIQLYIQELKEVGQANKLILRSQLREENLKSIKENLASASRLRKLCNGVMDDIEDNAKSKFILTETWLSTLARAYDSISRLEGKAHERMILESGLEAIADEVLSKQK